MSKIFSSPKAPAPIAAPPAPPAVDTEGVQAAGDAERRRQRAAKGRASTMLTGGSGVTSEASVGTAKLLG